MMEILSAKKYGIKLKATIQATGKLGFPKSTSETLNFAERKYVKFGRNEEGLFMSILADDDDDAFKTNVSSGYYSLNTKGLFDALGLDYKRQTVIFDLIRTPSFDEELNGEAYKMILRIRDKKDKEMES